MSGRWAVPTGCRHGIVGRLAALGVALALAGPGTGRAAASQAAAEADALRVEADWSVGHQASSSPLVRVDDEGALVRIPGLARQRGTVRHLSANASADRAVAGPVHLSLTGVVDDVRSDDAPGLAFGLALADLSIRWPAVDGMVGVGVSVSSLSVAGEAFRRSSAAHIDWSVAPQPGEVRSWRIEVARHRHAATVTDLDAEVLAASAFWRRPLEGAWFDSIEASGGWRLERNRQGLADLSHRGVHLMAELGWSAWGAGWRASVMWQRASFASSSVPDLGPRRDTFIATELSAEWPLSAALGLRASAGRSRNHAQPWLYENRQHHAELGLTWQW